MAPPENEEDFKHVLYSLGGGLANILFAFVCFVALIVFFDLNGVVYSILLALFIINLLMGLINLIPMSSTVPNDGMNIKIALKSRQAEHGLYTMLKVNYELSLGKRYRDFDESVFEVKEPADYSNYFIASMVIYKGAHLVDLGRWDDAIRQYDKLDLENLQAYYRNSIYLDYMYYYIVIKPDFEKAKEIYNKPEVKKFLKIKYPEMLKVLAAYLFFVVGDTDLGGKTLERAKASAANLPNEGLRLSIIEYLKELEEKMALCEN